MDSLILAIDFGKFDSDCCRCDMAYGRRASRACREKTWPAAEVVPRALNRADDAPKTY
jgi:hypothetical protein